MPENNMPGSFHSDVLFRHEVLAIILRVSMPAAQMQVLLRRRPRSPFAGMFSLPSGAVSRDADMPRALRARLTSLAGNMPLRHLEQVATYSAPERDPAQRTIATSYLGLVGDPNLHLDREKYPDMEWVDTENLPPLAFDHTSVVKEALERLRAKFSYTNIAFALAPSTFTMAELQSIYEAVLGHRIDVTNLRRILARRKQIENIGASQPSGERGGRPAALYRFTTSSYEVTDPFATFAPQNS